MSRASASGEVYLPPGERQELVKEVEQCDKDAETDRQNGNQQRLLVQLERGLSLRRRLYVEASPEVAAACRRLCEICNVSATAMIQQGNLKGAHELLKRAEQVSEKSDLDRAVTWNNLACYYRRTGKLRVAVSYLERALLLEEYVRIADAAQTHLNLCATLSQLNRHADALYHAQSALIRVYEILSPLMLSGKLSTLHVDETTNEQREQVTVLCIAYHNLAVEHEYLKNFEAALCGYAEGARWASQFLGETNQLCGILKGSVKEVKGKLPPTSAVLKRMADVSDGWTQKESSHGGAEDGSIALDHLVTPRTGLEGNGKAADQKSEVSTPQESQPSVGQYSSEHRASVASAISEGYGDDDFASEDSEVQ